MKTKDKPQPIISRWTKARIKQLVKLYPSNDNKDIAATMNTTVSSVRNAACKHKIKKAAWYWSKSDKKYLLKNYNSLSISELQDHLIGKTRWGIINQYRTLAGLRINNKK